MEVSLILLLLNLFLKLNLTIYISLSPLFELKVKDNITKRQAFKIFNHSRAHYEGMSDFLLTSLHPLHLVSNPDSMWNFIGANIYDARKIPSFHFPKYFHKKSDTPLSIFTPSDIF